MSSLSRFIHKKFKRKKKKKKTNKKDYKIIIMYKDH